MWIKFDGKEFKKPGSKQHMTSVPPEGHEVMVTDGENIANMWYIMSGEYEWFMDTLEDGYHDSISGDNLPFYPTHWMTLDNYKIWLRDNKIEKILDGEIS